MTSDNMFFNALDVPEPSDKFPLLPPGQYPCIISDCHYEKPWPDKPAYQVVGRLTVLEGPCEGRIIFLNLTLEDSDNPDGFFVTNGTELFGALCRTVDYPQIKDEAELMHLNGRFVFVEVGVYKQKSSGKNKQNIKNFFPYNSTPANQQTPQYTQQPTSAPQATQTAPKDDGNPLPW